MKITSLFIAMTLSSAWAAESFEQAPKGAVGQIKTSYGTLSAEAGSAEILKNKGRTGNSSIRILGGAAKELSLKLDKPLTKDTLFQAWGERWTGRGPFEVTVFAEANGKRTELVKHTKQGTGGFNHQYKLTIPKGTSAIIFSANTPDGGGIILDDIALHSGKQVIKSISVEDPGAYPIMKRAEVNGVVRLSIDSQGAEGKGIEGLKLKVTPASAVSTISLRSSDKLGYNFHGQKPLATATPDAEGNVMFRGPIEIPPGEAYIWIDATPSKDVKVGTEIDFSDIAIKAGGKVFKGSDIIDQSVGYLVATGGEEVKQADGSMRVSKCFRIPGLITSKDGTLVGVTDARYNHAGDLCADIDVAFMRSTDGGLTWTAPEVNMDIGTGATNGCGDPCILQDDNGRIWVQALGTHFGGGASLFTSKKGNDPKTTGQWYMSYSDDDGKTWTQPGEYVNPTKQIKKDEWDIILAGPGSGITLKDGTIVFPAQIWNRDASPNAVSTICYSKDGGKNWVYGTGLPRRTSESQIVELKDGSIMINARDEQRSGTRAVFITKDLGKTWTAHSTNLKDLREPVCQASLISIDSKKYGNVLLFSNPNAGSRKNMTIKFSLDEGKTWSKGYEYDTRDGAGYSSLALIDEDTVGVYYETSQGHVQNGRNFGISFLRIPLEDIMKSK